MLQAEFEKRLRRLAARRGVRLKKADRYDLRNPRFTIFDPSAGKMAFGGSPSSYLLSLEDVEKWLEADVAV